ncbi:threonine transporter RhtB [Vibrio diabolicus]|uniref:Threonine transporter RhtB n=1 Tax=Vibrio diabolicus TaxID=50719 RepID=A0AAX1XL27_9VIBR|nr:threonine transporter RhtB [Vibrio diabolicus]MCR9496147.1 threonine transporter RhtB [Vibrio alginolyticus]MCS0348826.1 threonine transporter RhtB [Vibrio diabolicus]MCS0361298.1 threonine transporter RhtB [Vibrio diabolicus]MCS0374323.1 threonine transporter RhtB [Vibrio diabolicus]MCS0403421.1 threonine transporter RhtB [Vibrio diabolicus]
MRNIYHLLILLVVFITGVVGAIVWQTWPQVQFAQRGMAWSWHWGYFEPFSNGIQQTRTQDTKQLLLRRVYMNDGIVVFVSTTVDNKFEVDVVKEQSCEPKTTTWASVSVNHQRMRHVPMVCDALGQSYFYRYIGKYLESIEVGVGDSFVTEAFSDWPLSELKSDQFKQKNAKFFQERGEKVEHQWLRD